MKQTFKKLSAFMMALAFVTLSGVEASAQVPQKFNYQGIARDTKGNPMAQQRMTLKLTVLPTADATTGEYEEIQTVTTNEFGLYTLQIGNGTPVTGEMKAVKWETGNKYIKVAIDPKGGSDFVDAGTNQLLSVPYAIYADKAGTAKNAGGGDRVGNVITPLAGTGTVNYLTKFTAANTIYNSQLFDNGTNIGIGTTTPAARLHLYSNVGGVQQQIRMQNASTTGASRFRMDNDGALSYATFSKYGTAYASGYPGIPALYPYANLLAFGNNGVVADDGLGRFLISNGGNIGISMYKGGTSKLKFHADYTTENVGIGGNSAPVSRVHLNNTDGTSMDLRLTNTTTGHTATDGMTITMSGNNATINNRENSSLAFATNNTERVRIDSIGRVGLGITAPLVDLHLVEKTGFTETGILMNNALTGYGINNGTRIRQNALEFSITNNSGSVRLGTNSNTRLAITSAGLVGINTLAPTTQLDVNGQIRIQGGAPGAGKVLTSDATGLATWQTPSGGGSLSGSGTLNYVPKFTPNGTTFGNSSTIDSIGFIRTNSTMDFSNTYNYASILKAPSLLNNSLAGFGFEGRGAGAFTYLTIADSNADYYKGLIIGSKNQINNFSWSNDSAAHFLRIPGNKTLIGGGYFTGGLIIEGANGKIHNGSINNTGSLSDAHFAINSLYDTAGHFTSSSSNYLANGILRAEYTGSAIFDHVAIYGKSTPGVSSGIGMKGEGNLYGVQGVSNGRGVYGEGIGSAYGVVGYSPAGVGVLASSGFDSNPNAMALYAFAAGNKGVGVRALADSNQAGVFTAGNGAYSDALYNGVVRGEFTGVFAQDAVGVYGKSTPSASYGIGVKGVGNWFGVYGISNDYTGIYGQGNIGVYGGGIYGSTINRYGIYGTASGATTNYAGFFDGTLYATTLTGGTKPFTIDHPLDPTNKYLRHSSIESNDMMNLYNGNITTDANGYATVEMPDYFEALNENFKYQLTVIGTFAQAIIKEEISNNKFVIQTSQPNVKVSWQVSGVRHDAVAKKYPVVVEEMKPEGQKGLYLEPEAFGQPKEMGANNPDRIKKEKNVTTDYDFKADTQRLIEKAKADDVEMKRRKELQQEAEKNWKQQEAPKNTTRGTNGSLAPTK